MSIIGTSKTLGAITDSKGFALMLSIGFIGNVLLAKNDLPSLVYAIFAIIFAPARKIIEYITTKPIPIICAIIGVRLSSALALKLEIKYITTIKIGAISKFAIEVIASELLRMMDFISLFISDTTTLFCFKYAFLDSAVCALSDFLVLIFFVKQ